MRASENSRPLQLKFMSKELILLLEILNLLKIMAHREGILTVEDMIYLEEKMSKLTRKKK